MKRDNMEYVLMTIARIFEHTAQKPYIDEFKERYSGVRWHKDIESSLIRICSNTFTIDKWIDNLTSFMREKDIAIELK